MLEVDFHSHSLFSLCGLHSFVEMLRRAKELGMKALAITDHGLAMGGRQNSVFYQRMNDPVPGIQLLKGMECNVVDETGKIDCLTKYLDYMDIILLGIHPNTSKNPDRKANTELLLRAIEKNQYIDIITHPNTPEYPIDFEIIATAVKGHGMAMEINNSKTLFKDSPDSLTVELLNVCKKTGCPVVINSDAHTLEEVGLDSSVRPLLKQVDFPEDLILNKNAPSAFSFIQKRKALR